MVHWLSCSHTGCDQYVAGLRSYSVRKLHGTMPVHSRLLVAVDATTSTCVELHSALSLAHTRSEVAVGASDSYSELG